MSGRFRGTTRRLRVTCLPAVPRSRAVVSRCPHPACALTFVAIVSACKPGDDATGGSEVGTSSETGQPTSESTALPETSGAPDDSGSSGPGSSSESGPIEDPDPFTITALDHQWLSSFEASQSADAEIELGEGPFTSVTLVVELESPCFPFEKWADDPPPDGQNWPATCDAFDRIVNLVADPAEEGAPPDVELFRGITPFGGPQTYETDVTDWANALPGTHTLRGFVATWTDGAGQVSGSEGGWFMSVRLEVDPGPPPRNVLAAIPLVHADIGPDTSSQSLELELPEGTTAARLDYVVSGHGGAAGNGDCIGPADEFCHRVHTLAFDDTELGSFDPWRDDCIDLCTITEFEWPDGSTMDYCMESPCGAIGSVQAPRANWCPSAPVPPFAIDLAQLATPGPHTFSFTIDGIADGGVWPTSAIVYAFGE